MCRLVSWVSDTPLSLHEVLGERATQRFAHLSDVHADGWGAAWHDDDGQLRIHRSALGASTDPGFGRFRETIRTRVGLVHLRLATAGGGHDERNSHPFSDGRWALAHNGSIRPPDRLDQLLAADPSPRPQGDTDTERYFLALRDELDRNGGQVPDALDGVVRRMAEAGLTSSSLNAMLLGPDALNVISWHDPHGPGPHRPVWPADEIASGAVLPPYYPLSLRTGPGLVAAVSSGIVQDPTGWDVVPNYTVVTVDLATAALSQTQVVAPDEPAISEPTAGSARPSGTP
jgi:hypothetical protein